MIQAVQYGKRIKAQMACFHEYQLLPLGRTNETLYDLYAQDIAEGTILSACEELAGTVKPVQEAVKEHLTHTANGCGLMKAALVPSEIRDDPFSRICHGFDCA